MVTQTLYRLWEAFHKDLLEHAYSNMVLLLTEKEVEEFSVLLNMFQNKPV